MTTAHILYIPTVFMLGVLTGMLLKSQGPANDPTQRSSISVKTLIGSGLIFLFTFIGTHFFHIPKSAHAVTHALHGAKIFDKSPSFSSEEVYRRIASFPKAGIDLYKQFTYTTDVLFPVTLFIFLILLSRYISKRTSTPRGIQITLLIITALWFSFDMAENLMVYNLLRTFPVKNHLVAGVLGYVTIVKFSLLLLSVVALSLAKLFQERK